MLGQIAGNGFAHHSDAAGSIVAIDEIDGLGEFFEPRLDRLLQPFDILDLNRIVADQLA